MRATFKNIAVLFLIILVAFFEKNLLFAQAAGGDSLAVPPVASDTTKKITPPPATTPAPVAAEKSIVELLFLKEKIEQSPDSSYFNILKVTNRNGHSIKGTVRLTVPEGWKLVSPVEVAVDIAPDNTEIIPIRVSLARSAIGGVSYLVTATLRSDRILVPGKNQFSVSKTCYITIPKTKSWDVYPVQRALYFNRYEDNSALNLRMINKGNGMEVVKLDFEIGSSLRMSGALGSRYFTSVELRPHCDTVVSFPVKYAPLDESVLWNRDFKKQSIRIAATSDTIVKRSAVNFKYLESTFYNMLYSKQTPLTVELQLQNLLAESDPRMLIGASGVVLLKNDDVFDYNMRFMNLQFSGYSKGDNLGYHLWTRSQLEAGYTSEKWEVRAGDYVTSFAHSYLGSVGRGIGGLYKLNSDNTVGGAFSAALTAPVYSGNVFYSTKLTPAIPLTTALNAIVDNYNRINAYGLSLNSSFTFLKVHSVSILLAPALVQNTYDNQTFKDVNGNFITTTDPKLNRFGLAGNVNYRYGYKKLNAGLGASFATRDYWQSYSGNFSLSSNAQYVINRRFSLLATSGVYLQDPKRYDRGILYPRSTYLSGMHRVELSTRLTNKLTAFTGPVLDHFSYHVLKINSQAPFDSTFTHFSAISPKLSLRCSYKNSSSGFISPYTMFGYTYVTSAVDSTIFFDSSFVHKSAFFNAKAGLNVMQGNWGVNVLYYYGPQSFSGYSDYYYFGKFSKSIYIMPFIQKYYFNKTMLLSSYNNYAYEVSSNTERLALNARLKFFMGRDWEFFVDNNLYMSSRINKEGQKIYGRSYYLSLGVKKSFDIPQPRVKYYDLKIVCFKDINGNQIKDENEYGLSDIVITIDRHTLTDSTTQKTIPLAGQFAPAEMVTDNFGQVIYYHLPDGEFDVRVIPLQNLKDLYNVNGPQQKVNVLKDTTYYIPFVQSFRVFGKVILVRDEYTSLGTISPANVRVTATDSLGNGFPALTAADGSYVIYVPKAGEYKVSINKVFGDNFTQQDVEYTVSFDGAREFHVDFIFNEKKRQMNINGTSSTVTPTPANTTTATVSTNTATVGGVGNKSGGGPAPLIIAGQDTLKDAKIVTDPANAGGNSQPKAQDSNMPVGPGISYRIQLTSRANKIPRSQYATKFKNLSDISEYSESGVYKYTSGDVKTIEEAKALKAKLRSKGFSDAFMVPFYKGTRVRY